MASRIRNLLHVLEARGCRHVWERENMNLWRMTTPDQPEKWFAPTGEEFLTCEDVALYLLSLPPGGSPAKFMGEAPSDEWVGQQLELQEGDVSQDWARVTIVERSGTTCKVQDAGSGSVRIVDIVNTRCRWAHPAARQVQVKKQQCSLSNASLKEPSTQDAVFIETSTNNAKRKRTVSGRITAEELILRELEWEFRSKNAPRLRAEASRLRRTILRSTCVKAASILQTKIGTLADSIASFLEEAESILDDLARTCDASQEVCSIKKVVDIILSEMRIEKHVRTKFVGSLSFVCYFDGEKAGQCIEVFGRSGDVYEGLAALGKTIESSIVPNPETNAVWCFYRALAIIASCHREIETLAEET